MTDYTALIARLRAAKEPDRELDRDIAVSILGMRCMNNLMPFTGGGNTPRWWMRDGNVCGPDDALVGRYTASLDACRALQERAAPGFRTVLAGPALGKPWEVALAQHANLRMVVIGKAATPELAWLIAIFETLQANQKDKEND